MPPLNNEDWAIETPEVVIDSTTKEEVIETPKEETPKEEAPKEDDSDIDEILEALLKEDTPPTEPVFPEKEKVEEVEEFIDEALLDDLDASFEELETKLEEKDVALTEKEKALLDETNKALAFQEALDKLWEHPILWPLNEKILRWEKVDIPEYLQKSLQDDLDSLPKMDENAHEPTWVDPKPSLQTKIEWVAKNRY